MTDTLEQIILDVAESIRPPERLTISQAAEKYRYLNVPGGYIGPWKNSTTPYVVEVADTLSSREHTGCIFVGPARAGKSEISLNWLLHTTVCDPMDMMFIHMTQASSRDWSKTELARLFRNSPAVGERLAPGRQNDNTHDKEFRSGMKVLVKWPTITELSGKTIPYIGFVDYDRIKPEDVDKEGLAFDLGKKRTQTFGRHGMTFAESSPGWPVEDPRWVPATPHEAPPTQGILALYNRGDRRRWYWRCPKCHGAFEPSFKLMDWPSTEDFDEAGEQAALICPHDGFRITQDMRAALNDEGKWVRDGQVLRPDGQIVGTPLFPKADIASFWLQGPAATFMPWRDMISKYLTARKQFEATGSESLLVETVTQDQGLPHIPSALEAERLPEALRSRAQDWGGSKEEPVVPDGVRFLVAAVDVQAGGSPSFVVQVHGFGVGGECWIVDMFKVRKSKRIGADGEHERLDPSAYSEDWDLLISEVMEKTYLLADGSGRKMQIRFTVCDSGGREGVTTNAYNFWRRLRTGPHGWHRRFHLVKGEPKPSAPRQRVTYPDSNRKDRHSGARGDVPVMFVNTNIVKDQASNMLGRVEPGARVNLPIWAENWLYQQLTAEVRTTKKGWENPRRVRNEAWDLLVYALAACLLPGIAIERIDWNNPPTWARDWPENDLVISADTKDPFVPKADTNYDLRALADKLG